MRLNSAQHSIIQAFTGDSKNTPPNSANTLIFSNICAKILFLTAIAAAIFSGAPQANAQQVSLKSNLLYDATLSPNLGVEIQVAPRWSIDVSGNINSWSFSEGRRWKHWLVQPEARFWLCDATAGPFFAVHALGGKFNFGHLGFARNIFDYEFSSLRDHRYQGTAFGAGLGYGYSWILATHWSLEAELGVGWIYAKYDVFECEGCGRRVDEGHKHLILPTKAAISIVYIF